MSDSNRGNLPSLAQSLPPENKEKTKPYISQKKFGTNFNLRNFAKAVQEATNDLNSFYSSLPSQINNKPLFSLTAQLNVLHFERRRR